MYLDSDRFLSFAWVRSVSSRRFGKWESGRVCQMAVTSVELLCTKAMIETGKEKKFNGTEI